MVTAGRADGRAGGRADGRAGGRAGGQDARSRADDNLSSSVDVAVHEKGAATSATATSDTATTIAIAAVTAGAAPSNAATALASAQRVYLEGQGSSSEELGDDDVTLPPTRPSTRVGQAMEIQGCEPNTCDYICTECDWEACTVVADDGTTCDVKLVADGTECSGVNSRRFLRYPQSSKRARRFVEREQA